MIKKVLTLIIGVVLVAAVSSVSWAQQRVNVQESDISQRLGFGYRFGNFKDKDTGERPTVDVDQKHSLLMIYGITPYTAIQLEGAFGTDWNFDTEFYSVFADLQLRLPMEEFAGYIFGGAGFQNDRARSLFVVDDSLVWRAGVGAEYFMTEQTALNLEGIYNFDDGDDTYDSWEIRAGLTYYF